MSIDGKHTWSKYYNSIRDVCPFSGFAYTNGALIHLKYRSRGHVLQNEGILQPMGLWGAVYEGVDMTPDELEDWTSKMNSRKTTHIQYFWSHPEHSPTGRATTIPVIIQQRRDVLERARRGDFNVLRSETSEDSRVTPKNLEKSTKPYGTKTKR